MEPNTEDFRKLYLLRMNWRTEDERWTCDAIDYWTTLEDALEIQNEHDKQELSNE